ncbi:MAG: NAD(P)-dependent oxidoreductase [Phycisphaerales bacterium]|nr:MAG: NAD(P)-dependent oxidoreductase [Phycisphaerales bacterium]
MTPSDAPAARPGRLLITGITGFLGSHLAIVAHRAGWQVVGLARNPPERSTPNTIADFVRADLAQPGAARDAIERLAPDAVVHCAANARTDACERFPEAAERDNVAATALLDEACRGGGVAVPMVVCSTDLVFDGRRPGGGYREDDPPRPINAYGRSKLAMERLLAERGSQAIVARLPLIFGPPAHSGGRGSFLEGWVERVRRGQTLVLFADEWRTPLSVRDAAGGLLACLARGRSGRTYHLAGPRRIDRYALGKAFFDLVAGPLGLDRSLVRPGRQADVPMLAPRAQDVSLDGSRAREELGFAPRALEEELAWTAGRMARSDASEARF